MTPEGSDPSIHTHQATVLVDEHSISGEAIYAITAFVFAGLITILIGLLGVSWLLPALQAVGLTIFMLPLIRRGKLKRAVGILSGWLLIQFVIIMFLSMVAPSQMENTISDGFNRRTGMLAWFYALDESPYGLVDSLGSRLLEALVVCVGSLATVGLIGFWLVIRGVNLAAFYSGTILTALSDTANGIGAFPVWTVCRLFGYSLLSVLSAGLLFSSKRQLVGSYLKQWRMLWLAAGLFILLGLLFENTLPNLWRTWFS